MGNDKRDIVNEKASSNDRARRREVSCEFLEASAENGHLGDAILSPARSGGIDAGSHSIAFRNCRRSANQVMVFHGRTAE